VSGEVAQHHPAADVDICRALNPAADVDICRALKLDPAAQFGNEDWILAFARMTE